MAARRANLQAADVQRAVAQMAAAIAAAHPAGHVYLVGIQTAGVPLAQRLAAAMNAARADSASVGSLDIGLYRDDGGAGRAIPTVFGSHVPFDINGAEIVLVDDVLFTGRTIRAALDHLMDYGRPRRVELAVLVDRGHRELPIHADFCGFRIETGRDDHVKAYLGADPARDRVDIQSV
jgi:pyrimidine operon attenuation protein/uracil phosphoribosyltransferase